VELALIGASYLVGGIPTGYLTVRWLKGIDIREHGSGNPGAANVYRVAGPLAGAITLFVDAIKGFTPVWICRQLLPGHTILAIAAGAAAVIGHDWTVFLGFRGGKGVATSAGVFAALCPKAMAGAIIVFVIGFLASGHISVGSMAASIALPVLSLALSAATPVTAFAAIACALILYKHIPNLRRLLEGRELFLREKNK
jgi:glycerol-3-phosphate acyltransferase PlsY